MPKLINWTDVALKLTTVLSISFFSVLNNRGQSSIEKVIVLDFTNNDDLPASIRSDDTIQANDLHNAKGSFNIVMNNQMRLFTYEHVRFVLNADSEQFVRLRNLDESLTINEIMHARNNGVSAIKRDIL